jgi:acetyltransferase-like isoleucine patch superfamily enzyme
MLGLIKLFWNVLMIPKRYFLPYFLYFFNFLKPNLRIILLKKISIVDKPAFIQKTIFRGLGFAVIGKNCKFGYKLGGFHSVGVIEIQPRYANSKIIFGDRITVNNNFFACSANYIKIGDDTLIGHFVSIRDHDAHGIDPEKRGQVGEIGEVIIGKNVWIGNNVIILKNTRIGDNTIVAAGAVVAGEFPANVIIGGVPAKIIRAI